LAQQDMLVDALHGTFCTLDALWINGRDKASFMDVMRMLSESSHENRKTENARRRTL
jgi:hypothetical protein